MERKEVGEMNPLLIGTIQKMKIKEKVADGYIIENNKGEVLLAEDQMKDCNTSDLVMVFIYATKDKQVHATTKLPTVELGSFGWGKVVEVVGNLGVYIDIETEIDVLVSSDDLPALRTVWPTSMDKLYVHLKKDNQNRLFAVPASERDFQDFFTSAGHVELNDRVEGSVIRVGKEGSVMMTESGYRGFIHHSERDMEPRLGQFISGRVIEVKEDGTLNVSLLPLKHERIDDDAEKIFTYLEANGGTMPFGNKTDSEIIQNTFGMSKSAFKRALGRLLKERKIEPQDTMTKQL